MTYPNEPGFVNRDTSEAAAASIVMKLGELQTEVFTFIRAAGFVGATDEEIQRILDMRPNTARPRRRELEMKGLVFDSGRRRITSSGRDAIVWVAYEEHVEKNAPKRSDRNRERQLLRVLYKAAPSHQGGHSDVGQEIADLLGVPFPLRMHNLQAAAIRDGFDPADLWPWWRKEGGFASAPS